MTVDASDPASRIIGFYQSRVAEFGLGYRAQWGDDADWKADQRFAPLLTLPLAPGDILVDIGCGTGRLAGFLKHHVPGLTYVGIELTPEFAAQARAQHGIEVVEIDGMRDLDSLPAADWYVTFGTLNKDWCLEGMPGETSADRILGYLATVYARARKGVAASLVTNRVEYLKSDTCNMDPSAVATRLAVLTPHFAIYHGYGFYEFFAAAWRGRR